MSVAIRIEVDTLHGLLEGVPAILGCLEAYGARATFFFATGVDRTRRFWPPSFTRGVTWMRSARDAGHECGVLSADPVRWRERAGDADASWTATAMQAAITQFAECMGEAPHAHAAAGWQVNRHALRLTQRLGFGFASDGRGTGPHFPVWQGELVRCPQVPTTLATLDELFPSSAPDVGNAVSRLLQATVPAEDDERAHVYSMSAVRRSDPRFAALQALVEGWTAQGHAVRDLGSLIATLPDLPRCNVAPEDPPAGRMFTQGEVFLGDIELPEAA